MRMDTVFLVWGRESYCDYNVVYATLDENKAKKICDEKNYNDIDSHMIEEIELDKFFGDDK